MVFLCDSESCVLSDFACFILRGERCERARGCVTIRENGSPRKLRDELGTRGLVCLFNILVLRWTQLGQGFEDLTFDNS